MTVLEAEPRLQVKDLKDKPVDPINSDAGLVTKSSVRVGFFSIRFNREDEGRHLASAEMTNLQVDTTSNVNARTTTGTLGNLVVNDLGDHETVHRELVGLQDPSGSSLMSFQFSKIDRTVNDPGYDNELKVEMSPLRIVYLQSRVLEVVDYVLGEGVMGSVTPVVKAAMARLPSKTKLQISLQNPTIMVPCSAQYREMLAADLGTIRITNEFVVLDSDLGVEVDRMHIVVHKMNLAACGHSESETQGPKIVQDTEWDIHWDRPLGSPEMRVGTFVPDMKLVLKSTGVHVDLTEWQYGLVLAVQQRNLSSQWVKIAPQAGTVTLAQTKQVAPKTVFSVAVDSLTVQLYQGEGSETAQLVELRTDEFNFRYTVWMTQKEMD